MNISKIVFEKEDGEEVEFSLAEVKALRKQLNSLFEEKVTFLPAAPLVVERYRQPPPYVPVPTWYSNDTINVSKTSSSCTSAVALK